MLGVTQGFLQKPFYVQMPTKIRNLVAEIVTLNRTHVLKLTADERLLPPTEDRISLGEDKLTFGSVCSRTQVTPILFASE